LSGRVADLLRSARTVNVGRAAQKVDQTPLGK
jgi:hypothetical protein